MGERRDGVGEKGVRRGCVGGLGSSDYYVSIVFVFVSLSFVLRYDQAGI